MPGLTTICVFLFAALALAVSSGYSLGALVLLLASASLLWKRPQLGLQRQDRLLIATLLLYFLYYTANMLLHGDPMRELDMPLRALLAVPVLLLLLAYPPRPLAWWAGVAIGAMAGTALALWQFIVQDMPRPDAATSNAIHYGNVSMLLGMLSLAGIEWASLQRRRLAWMALMLAGCLAGMTGSVISGSRGGWLVVPVCLLIFAVHLGKKRGMRHMGAALATLTVLLALSYFLPHSPVPERAAVAVAEVKKFEDEGNAETSVGQRLAMWRNALELSRQQPLLGIGRSGFMEQKEALAAQGKLGKLVSSYTNAHNDYLDALVKRGIAGVLVLLALLLLPLVLFARALRHSAATAQPYALAGVMLCTCYTIFGLTTTSLTLNIGIIMLVFPMMMLWAQLRHQQRLAPAADCRAGQLSR